MVEFLYYDYFKEYQLIRFDFVSGGEPLLNFNIIKKLKLLLDRYNAECSKSSFIWMCSNAYLLNDEILEYLEKNKIGLGISFEGGKEYHDELRALENAQGTYDYDLSSQKYDYDKLDETLYKCETRDILAKCKNDYNTLLTPEFTDGIMLSGGEWQKVAISRAFYSNRNFIIFDEPTAALDPLAEVKFLIHITAL